MSKKSIVISSQKDAWNLITDLGTAKLKAANLDVKYENFPHLEIKYEGDQFKSSLPFRAIEAISRVQSDVYTAYSLAKYGDEKHTLTPSEKESLEIVVKVKSGSSILDVSLGDQATKMLTEALQKMEPVHVITVVTIAAIAWAAPKIVKQYQETKRKKVDADLEKHKSDQETKRIQAMASLVEAQTKPTQYAIETLVAAQVSTAAKLAKVAKGDDTVELGDFEKLTPEKVKEEFKQVRSTKSEAKTITKMFKIKKVGWKNDFIHRTVTLESGGKDLAAQIPNEKEDIVRELFAACLDKRSLRLEVEGKLNKHDFLDDAQIVRIVENEG